MSGRPGPGIQTGHLEVTPIYIGVSDYNKNRGFSRPDWKSAASFPAALPRTYTFAFSSNPASTSTSAFPFTTAVSGSPGIGGWACPVTVWHVSPPSGICTFDVALPDKNF
jgi:hypothetical protein